MDTQTAMTNEHVTQLADLRGANNSLIRTLLQEYANSREQAARIADLEKRLDNHLQGLAGDD